ncbi:MAG: TlpA disulfide reductase family protein [Cyclobacteriaceae bacterium]
MKKINQIIAYLIVAMAVVSCSNPAEDGIPVVGTIEGHTPGQPVILQKYTEQGLDVVDTIAVDESGAFKTATKVAEPTFFRINFYNRKFANLILDGSEEKIEVIMDMEDNTTRPTVTGSTQTNHLAVYDRLIDNMKEDQQLINQQGMEARATGNQAEMDELSDEYMTLLADFYEQVKDYSHKIKPSLAVFYGIGSLSIEDNIEFYDSLASFYNEKLPDHFFTKNMVAQVNALKDLSIGSAAPEISLPNPEGDIITLSSLKGKYVLIDFWAAWCRPCRMENPNVVKLYNQYKKENFEILGVSLDRDRKAWVGAIEKDGLTWQHVSDLQYFNSQAAQDYKIQAIPATYLIGPDGKIVAKGLRGLSLENKLKEIFG